jgi:hypothetical protein
MAIKRTIEEFGRERGAHVGQGAPIRPADAKTPVRWYNESRNSIEEYQLEWTRRSARAL